MANDPYAWPGTETLRNRLGIRDDQALDAAERDLTRLRGNEADRMSFPLTADGYRALHRHLFQDVYDWAGRDRTVGIAKTGVRFAHAGYVANSLDTLFRGLANRNGLRGLHGDEFFDRLGHHINELNAVHPFREGNGRTMRHHATQIAREAGYPISIGTLDRTAWMEASRHGFLTGDHRAMTTALAASAIRRDLAPEARTGLGGLAMLPTRDPPIGQRYRITLDRVRDELEHYLPIARAEATNRLLGLTRDGAAPAAIDGARGELAYLRHPKGPVYQAQLLTYLGIRQIDAVLHERQTPLERVRELGATIGVHVYAQQPAQIQRAIRSLERPVLPPGYAPGQERLATAFLKNEADKNRADPRLARAQQIVDAAVEAAREQGSSPRAVAVIGEAARKQVAERIRTGEPPAYSAATDRPSGERPPERGR